MTFDSVQLRVLGALIEKEITTPENYPLSLNALLNACNQRSSRDPVMTLEEEQVQQALYELENLGIVARVNDARVPKYEHLARTVLNLRRDETAVLCLLLLRGPQTVGELRSRAERLYSFDETSAVQSTLERLARRESLDPQLPEAQFTGPLTRMLPRQPGSRESRYIHLLGDASEWNGKAEVIPQSSYDTRIIELESALAALHLRVKALESRLPSEEAKETDISAK